MEDKLNIPLYIEEACKQRFVNYKSKQEIVVEEVGEDLDILFEIVKQDPEWFQPQINGIKQSIVNQIMKNLGITLF